MSHKQLTRKDFRELAEILREHRRRQDFDELVYDVMRFCKRRNGRFSHYKFQKAVYETDD